MSVRISLAIIPRLLPSVITGNFLLWSIIIKNVVQHQLYLGSDYRDILGGIAGGLSFYRAVLQAMIR